MATEARLFAVVEARLDKFEKQLKQAGVMADDTVKDIEGKFEKMDLGKGAAIGTFLGGIAGNVVTQAIDFLVGKLKEVAQKFVDIQDAAAMTGVAIVDLTAAAVALGSPEGFGKAFTAVATMLDRAKRGEVNALVEQFKQMGVTITQSMTPMEAWVIAMERIQTAANPIRAKERADALKIPDDVLKSVTQLQTNYEAAFEAMLEKTKAVEKMTADLAVTAETLGAKLAAAAAGGLKLYTDGLDILFGKKEKLDALTASTLAFLAATGVPTVQIEPSTRVSLPGASTPDAPFKTDTAAASREKLSSLQRLVIEQEKQEKLARSELELVSATNVERAKAKGQIEAEAAAAKDVERGLKIAPALIAERTEAIKRSAAAEAEFQQKLRETNFIVAETKAILGDSLKVFIGALREGKSAADALRLSLERISERLLDKAIDLALNMAFSGNITGTGTGGGLGQLIAGLVGGSRMAGGPVDAGKFYLVGENGPEMVRFGRSGVVMPNLAAISGGGSPGFSVVIENHSQAQVQVEQPTQRSDGIWQMKQFIRAEIDERVGSPSTGANRTIRMMGGKFPLTGR